MASAAEIALPILLALGLLTWWAALGLLVMTATIQLTYPDGWANFHPYWAAMALAILTFGPGAISLDRLIGLDGWSPCARLTDPFPTLRAKRSQRSERNPLGPRPQRVGAAPGRERPHAYWIAPEPEPQPVHLSMQSLTQVLHSLSQGVCGGKHLKIQAAEHAPEHAAICPVPPHELA